MMKTIFLSCFIFPALSCSAGAEEGLPEGFSRSPNCADSTICLSEDVFLEQRSHFDAVEAAVASMNRDSLKIFHVGIDKLHEGDVYVYISYVNSDSIAAHVQRQGDRWVVVGKAIMSD